MPFVVQQPPMNDPNAGRGGMPGAAGPSTRQPAPAMPMPSAPGRGGFAPPQQPYGMDRAPQRYGPLDYGPRYQPPQMGPLDYRSGIVQQRGYERPFSLYNQAPMGPGVDIMAPYRRPVQYGRGLGTPPPPQMGPQPNYGGNPNASMLHDQMYNGQFTNRFDPRQQFDQMAAYNKMNGSPGQFQGRFMSNPRYGY